MRLIVSGTRDGVRQARVDDVLDGYLALNAQLTIVEGCAPGVDSQAHAWARRHGAIERDGRIRIRNRGSAAETLDRLELEHWPALWLHHEGCWCGPTRIRCNFAGHRRNREMADSGVDEVVAFHPDLAASKGTRRMAEIALELGIRLRTIGSVWPPLDGRVHSSGSTS